MITGTSKGLQARAGYRHEGIQSRSGLWGSLLVVAMLPLTILYQLVFTNGVDTFVHWILAAGALLIALAVWDFRLPAWIQWLGALSAVALAVIFFLQGLSHLVQVESLTTLAYATLANWPEPWLLRVFLIGWGTAVLMMVSQGKTRIFGYAALLCVLAMELYRFALPYFGGDFPQALRATYLVPFVWLFFESIKRPSGDK